MDLDDLQKFVDAGDWKTNPELLKYIYEKYCQLTENCQRQNLHFGSVEFWKAIFGEDQEGILFIVCAYPLCVFCCR